MRTADRDAGKMFAVAVAGTQSFGLIAAPRHRADVLDRRVAGGPAGTVLFSIGSGASSEAVDVHLEDCGMMDETVYGSQGHGGIGEDIAPFAERLVGG